MVNTIRGTRYTQVIIDEISVYMGDQTHQADKEEIRIAKNKDVAGLSFLYEAMGFEEDKEALRKVKPLGETAKASEIMLEDILDEVQESSAFGPEADKLWERLKNVNKVKELSIPDGVDMDTIRADIITELRAMSRVSDRRILDTLTSSPVAVPEGDDFI